MVDSAPRPRDWDADPPLVDPMLSVYVEILQTIGRRYMEQVAPFREHFPPPGRRTDPQSLGLGLVFRWAEKKLPAEQVAAWIDRYQRGGSPDERRAERAWVVCEVLLELGQAWFREHGDELVKRFGAPGGPPGVQLAPGVDRAHFNHRMASVMLLAGWAMDVAGFPPEQVRGWLDKATRLAAIREPVALVPAERWRELQDVPLRIEAALQSLEGCLPPVVVQELRDALQGACQVPVEAIILALPPDQRQTVLEVFAAFQ